jgi:hypothetical protein
VRLARLVTLVSVCSACAVNPVGGPERLTTDDGTQVVQRYDITGVLPGGAAIRVTGRDEAGREFTPALRYWIVPPLIVTGAVALNAVLVGTPTIWHLVAGRPDYLPTPDRWCLTTLVGTCRVTVEGDEPARARP